MAQSCGTCKRFRRIEDGHHCGYCTWHAERFVDMPDWAHLAIECARDERAHYTEESMGTTCDCYDEIQPDHRRVAVEDGE